MAKTSLDGAALNFNCPKCGQKINATVGGIKKPDAKCPRCGAGFDTTEFTAGIQDAERQTDEMLRKMSQTIKVNIKL